MENEKTDLYYTPREEIEKFLRFNDDMIFALRFNLGPSYVGHKYGLPVKTVIGLMNDVRLDLIENEKRLEENKSFLEYKIKIT